MSVPAARIVQALVRAESQIALLDRTRPLGLAEEFQRLLAAWQVGSEGVPRLRYAPRAEFGRLRAVLGEVVQGGAELGTEGPWLVERARELQLEAQMAETVGTGRFSALASERFSAPRGGEGSALDAIARGWIEDGGDGRASEPRFRSDDRQEPRSLWCVLAKRLMEVQPRVRLLVDAELMSVAACGDGIIAIRGGSWLTARAAVRIAEHEIQGHLLPRLAARHRQDVLRCGCAGGTDDEEGRALLLEQRQQLMDGGRRMELGVRHLACVYLRSGATFVDAVRRLLAFGAPLETVLRATLRASRGGGMGREIVYLAAMRRLGRAFEGRPELERWFESGRTSLKYATVRAASTQAA